MTEPKSFNELFAEDFEKNREKFREATKSLRAEIPIKRKFKRIKGK